MGEPLSGMERLLTEADTAALLRVKPRTVADYRRRGDGPPFIQISRNVVRYLADDVLQWATARRVKSANEARFVQR
jgi:hypothetical protein